MSGSKMWSHISISSLHASISNWMLSLAYSIKWLFHLQSVINPCLFITCFFPPPVWTSFSCLNSLLSTNICWAELLPVISKKNCSLPYLVCSCSLQSRCRCYLVRSQYIRLVKATITAQCGWRRRVARRELRNLKMVRNHLFRHYWTTFYLLCPFCPWCLAQ